MYVHTGDMYSHDGNADEPEWVKTEREQFVEFRDKNRDGKMDKEETKDWILPSDYDHAEAEARHLVYESDQNKVSWSGPNSLLVMEVCSRGLPKKIPIKVLISLKSGPNLNLAIENSQRTLSDRLWEIPLPSVYSIGGIQASTKMLCV